MKYSVFTLAVAWAAAIAITASPASADPLWYVNFEAAPFIANPARPTDTAALYRPIGDNIDANQGYILEADGFYAETPGDAVLPAKNAETQSRLRHSETSQLPTGGNLGPGTVGNVALRILGQGSGYWRTYSLNSLTLSHGAVTGPTTIEMVVMPASSDTPLYTPSTGANRQYIFEATDGTGADRFNLYYNNPSTTANTGSVYFEYNSPNQAYVNAETNLVLKTNEFQHIALAADTDNNQLKIYLDGTLVDTINVNFGVNEIILSADSGPSLGAFSQNQHFQGWIDSFAVTNELLGPGESNNFFLVPEPSSLGLLSIGLILIARSKRQDHDSVRA